MNQRHREGRERDTHKPDVGGPPCWPLLHLEMEGKGAPSPLCHEGLGEGGSGRGGAEGPPGIKTCADATTPTCEPHLGVEKGPLGKWHENHQVELMSLDNPLLAPALCMGWGKLV